jgi:predicted deacylase
VKIAKDPALQSVVHITTGVAGPRAVMFCSVHGDEVSGIHALEKLFFDLFGGKRTVLKASRGDLLSRSRGGVTA